MVKINQELVKCSLILGILFFVFSHPYLYRALHRQFSNILSFVDMNACPTESGVFVHAILFAIVIYFGKQYYDSNNKQQKVKKINNVDNEIKGKCRMYCEDISNEMKNNNVVNNVNQNLPNQAQLQLPNNLQTNNIPQVNNQNLANLQKQLPNLNNNIPLNNINIPNTQMNNNGLTNNNVQMNNNGLTNNMDYNNISTTGTQSTEINNLGLNNNQAMLGNQELSNNIPQMGNNIPQLSCGGIPNFTNQLSNSDMFMENTTYVDDMYMKL